MFVGAEVCLGTHPTSPPWHGFNGNGSAALVTMAAAQRTTAHAHSSETLVHPSDTKRMHTQYRERYTNIYTYTCIWIYTPTHTWRLPKRRLLCLHASLHTSLSRLARPSGLRRAEAGNIFQQILDLRVGPHKLMPPKFICLRIRSFLHQCVCVCVCVCVRARAYTRAIRGLG